MQEQISKGNSDGSLKLTKLAAEHGFEFTAEEAERAWNKVRGGELSDFDLEICAGGAGAPWDFVRVRLFLACGIMATVYQKCPESNTQRNRKCRPSSVV